MTAHASAHVSRPRIVFVNRYYWPDISATSQLLTDLTRRLHAAGFDVEVLCSRLLYETSHRALPPAELAQGVRVRRVWSTSFGRANLLGRMIDYASFYFSVGVSLLWRLSRGDVAVAKTDPPMLSVVVASAAALRGAVLVNWLQDLFPEVAQRIDGVPMPATVYGLLRTLRDLSLRGARANIVLGDRMHRELVRLGVPTRSIRTVPNWADGAAIRPMPPTGSRLRTQMGVMHRFVVEYSGNLGRAHDWQTILGAAERLVGDARFLFLMIGGGNGMQALQREVDARGLGNVRFLPYQEREVLADSLAAADVHLVSLLPQLEGLIVPSKAYGILAAGRPIVFIGDAAGEVAQLVDRHRCGFVVEVGAADRLAEGLRRLADDPAGLARMGTRARAAFEDAYTLDHAVAAWLTLLGDIGPP